MCERDAVDGLHQAGGQEAGRGGPGRVQHGHLVTPTRYVHYTALTNVPTVTPASCPVE